MSINPATGLYTADEAPGTYTVRATIGAISGTAGVTVSAPPFNPLDLSPHVWLAAYKESFVNNDLVGTPTDWSGNGRAPTQATGANKPTFKTGIVNGKPVFRFSTDDFWEFSDIMAGLTEAEVFIVLAMVNGTASNPLWRFGSYGPGTSTWYPHVSGALHDSWGSDLVQDTGGAYPDLSQWRLYNVNARTGEWTSRFDGTQYYTTAANTVGWSSAPRLGQNADSAFLSGDIAELIIVPNKLTAANRNLMGGYVQTEYGITIAGATFP